MSRQESPNPTQSTGAHRKHRAPAGRPCADAEPERAGRGHGGHREGRARRPQGTLPMQPPAHYEPYLDGLFTYCLSILCEHDAASGALGEVLALAERQRVRLRDPGLRRPWLYALARWVCLRRLAAGKPVAPHTSESVAEQRRAQLASLAWPESAGTSPEQREALELAVRHQLAPREVAHVVGLDAEAARTRLARAACEVERTRTAMAVVDTGSCPEVAQLAGDTQVLLGTALRTELVRHVDDCPVCRRTAERVVADGPWPGAADAAAVLPLVEAPRSAAYAALLHAMDTGFGRARESTPRFDRRGFPTDLGDKAARRAVLRHRAVTTTVVAAVVAAPVLAVWAAYRATPLGENSHDGRSASAPDGIDGVPYEKAGNAGPSPSAPAAPEGSGAPSSAGAPQDATVAVSGGTAPPASSVAKGAGWLEVAARPGYGRTYVTLTAGGAAPVTWAAATSAYWLEFSARSGTLKPGETVTLVIRVDRSLEPSGSWSAQIRFTPGDATVTLQGSSRRSVPPVSASPTGGSTESSSPPPSSSSPPPSSTPPTQSATPTDSSTPSASATASG
ncbi:BACON domain-containing protein [Streptomyces sp. NBC_00448]|uniref:BACON domain-containing protein n=1 Tax=Streptomyces sp. NBC_00448 TaxID=2903652 RepID=UPI002E1FC80A